MNMIEVYQVQGVTRSSGEYQGYPFDNYVLHCVRVDSSNVLCGLRVETLKCKVEWFGAIFDRILKTPEEFPQLLGMYVHPTYTKGGKVSKIDLVDQPDGKGVY